VREVVKERGEGNMVGERDGRDKEGVTMGLIGTQQRPGCI